MTTKRMLTVLAAAAAGAGTVYLLDPGGGRKRRAWLRDKAVRTARRSRRALRRRSRHLANRARGTAAGLRGRLRPRTDPDTATADRVRVALGRAVSHPDAIEVSVRDGRVYLGGPILASEVDALLGRVRGVRGVVAVENQLDVHDSPANTPALQGAALFDETPENGWSLGAKLIVSVASAVALGASLARASAEQGTGPRPTHV